jgi:Amt family ammonium transporter
MHRRKAALTMIFQSLFCACAVGIQFWVYGYSLYQSHTTGPFIGDLSKAGLRNTLGYPSLANPDIPDILYACFGFTFVTCTAMILAGAMLERGRMWPSMLFLLCWTTFVYYVLAYAEWNPSGWLFKLGVYDFAGSGPVHIASGFSALAWAVMLGPRIDPHKESHHPKMPHFRPHNPFLVGLGTILIWFGWYAFNGRSQFLFCTAEEFYSVSKPNCLANHLQAHPRPISRFAPSTSSATPTSLPVAAAWPGPC